MKVFIIGVSGAVGRLLARDLAERGDDVAGLVRREEQRADLSRWGVGARVGELNQGSTPIVNAVQASIRGGPPGRARRGPGDED